MFLRHIAWRIEEHDRVAERVEHEPNSNGQNAERAADQNQASLLAGHTIRLHRIAPSTFQSKTFDKIVDPLDLVRMFGECLLRIRGSTFGLVAFAEHRVGAD